VEKWMCSYDAGMTEKKGEARIVEANRQQTRLVMMDLEEWLPADHQARAIWAFVERLDMSDFLARIEAREGSAGRPATDPRILLGLWIMATADGVGSARELERLCGLHIAYQWMCGGVSVNYHTLSDFRSLSSDMLKGLLKQTVTILIDGGLVEMKRVAQDGMKVRAWAGAGSMRRRQRLKELKVIVDEQVETLSREIGSDPAAGTRREASARKRAAADRKQRIEQAIQQMDEAEERKESNNGKKKTEARVSTTDAECRVMKMPDGGFRPAYNIHLVTDAGRAGAIVAVKVDNKGTDLHAMDPLAEQIEQMFEAKPCDWLADGGCSSLGNIDKMAKRGCKVYSPLRPRRNTTKQPHEPRPGDSEAVREWRSRMNIEEAKQIYKKRGALAEWVNAHLRAQGLYQVLVRGTRKVLSVALLHAITHNAKRNLAFV
jgi:transposase